MGPWMHALPHMSPFEAIDFLPLAARWWDHWLCQIDNGVMDEAPVTLFVQGSNPGWRAYESWPAAQTELTLCTSADTTLTAPEAGEKTSSQLSRNISLIRPWERRADCGS